MDIYQNIRDGKYVVKDVPYVPYGEDKEKHMAWRKEEGRLIDLFYADVKEELGITDNPKADKLMSKAWDKGHSGGLWDVYIEAQDMVDLIK